MRSAHNCKNGGIAKKNFFRSQLFYFVTQIVANSDSGKQKPENTIVVLQMPPNKMSIGSYPSGYYIRVSNAVHLSCLDRPKFICF